MTSPISRTVAILAALLFPFMSAGAATADADPKVVAKEVCACLKEPHAKSAEIMAKFKAAQKSGDFARLMAMQGDMEGEMTNITKASQKCFDALEKKYPKIAADDEKRKNVNDIAEKMCPNPAEQMMGGRP